MTRINIVNWISIPIIVLYVFCMLIYPWIDGSWNWVFVQSVWHSWQSFNVGMLAFLSSIIALNISRFNDNNQRERNFIAARAFLPEALNELTIYFESSVPLLKEAWQRVNAKANMSPLETLNLKLPVNYKRTFSRCIESAEPDVGEFLAYMLMRLQVHNARIEDLSGMLSKGSRSIRRSENNIIPYMFRLGELQALANRIFEFARGLEKFNGRDLVWEDYQNAFSNLKILPEDYDDLIGFTKRAIVRKKNNAKS